MCLASRSIQSLIFIALVGESPFCLPQRGYTDKEWRKGARNRRGGDYVYGFPVLVRFVLRVRSDSVRVEGVMCEMRHGCSRFLSML